MGFIGLRQQTRIKKTSGPDSATGAKCIHEYIKTPGDHKTVRAELTDIGPCIALDPFSLKKYPCGA